MHSVTYLEGGNRSDDGKDAKFLRAVLKNIENFFYAHQFFPNTIVNEPKKNHKFFGEAKS